MRRQIRLYSFGYGRSGPPQNEELLLFDCRSLPNPHRVDALRELTGKDDAVKDFVMQSERAHAMLGNALKYATRGYTRIGFGCFGGRHRSVAMAEMMGDRLKDDGLEVEIVHVDL